MKRRNPLRRRTVGLVVSLSAAALLVLPPVSTGDPASDLIVQLAKGLNETLGPGDPQSASTRQTPGGGGYTPPAHGRNPHAQGTAASVDLGPAEGPLNRKTDGSGDPGERREEVVVGRARAERFTKGRKRYHGHITVLALFGNELLGVDTRSGQAVKSGLDTQAALNQLCTDTANQLCLQVLKTDSATSKNASRNTFAVASAQILGPTGIALNAVSSKADLFENKRCQTALAGSQVAGASVLGLPISAATSSSGAKKCFGKKAVVKNDSSVIGAGGPLAVPNPGCENGTPNSEFTPLAPLLTSVCNADDTNGTNLAGVRQLDLPYGVREALTAFVLELGGTSLLKATTAGAEVAVAGPRFPPEEPGPGRRGECPPDCPPGEFVTAEGLPVTGSDLVTIALLGALTLGLGLALNTALARRAS
jgi:hypothetical protein